MRAIRLFIYCNIFLLVGCRSIVMNGDVDICANAYLPCLNQTENNLLVTSQGKIKLELNGKKAQGQDKFNDAV